MQAMEVEPTTTSRQRRWPKRLLGVGFGLYALYAIGVGLVLPPLAREQLVLIASATLGREVRLDELRIDPFFLAVTLRGLTIPAQQGEPLLSADEVHADIALASLWQQAFVFDEARLSAPRVRLDIAADGSLEIVDLFVGAPSESATTEPAAEPAPLPAVVVRRFVLERGHLDFNDKSGDAPLALKLDPIDLTLEDFDTRPERDAPFTLALATTAGEALSLDGTFTLEPLQLDAKLQLDAVALTPLWRYARGTMPLELTSGTLDIEGDVSLAMVGDTPNVRFTDGRLAVDELTLATLEPAAKLLSLDHLELTDIDVDVPKKSVSLATLRTNGAELSAAIDAQGKASYASLLAPQPVEEIPAAADTAVVAVTEAAELAAGEAPVADNPAGAIDAGTPSSDTPVTSWTIALGELQLEDYAVSFNDESVEPKLALRLDPIGLQVKGWRSDGGEVDARLSVVVEGGGALDLQLAGPLAPLALTGTVQIDALPVALSEPYVRRFAHVTFASGRAAAKGNLSLADVAGTTAVRYDGSLDLTELALNRAEDFGELLAWKRLGFVALAVDTGARKLHVERVELDEPRTATAVRADGTLDIGSVLIAQEAAPAPAEDTPPGEPFAIEIGEFKLLNGTVRFADHTVKPAFTTALEEITGGAKNLHLTSPGPVDLELTCTIEGEADFRVAGRVSPVGHNEATDLQISLSGFDVTSLSPYSGRYAGYGVDKGRLTLNLAYRVDKNELIGTNALVAEQLALGDEVKSPDAVALPVKLALALLTDRKGRIVIDMPVRGKLDDPQFTLGGTILKTFGNLLEKTVTSPFSALGSLVGIGADELQAIEFVPGSAEFSATEQKKVDALAKALKDRPGLRLEIRGVADEAADGVILAQARLDEELRQAWLKEKGLPADDTTQALPSAERDRLLRARYTDELGSPAQGSSEELVAVLLDRVELDPDAMRLLARRRSAVVRDDLITRGVPTTQLFRSKSAVRAKGGSMVPTELTLSPS